MKDILHHLFDHHTLSRAEARSVLTEITQGKHNASQIAAFLTVFMMRSIAVEELEGFRDAMLELCLRVDLSEFELIDLCGTGGDGKDTFNVSTLASFVVAGAGLKVAKHGNYGVSSVSGSSNVLEYFGVTFTSDPGELKKNLERAGICFMHAPLFHPAMKNVGPIRRALGVRTFFNMLGPMVNPAFPQNQMVGVFSLELARLYGYLYQQSGKRFTILHSLDGYDEISLTSKCRYHSNKGEGLLTPETLGLQQQKAKDLFGGNSVKEAAAIFDNILNNKGTEAQKQVVIANAAAAIHTASEDTDWKEAAAIARESLESGSAKLSFKKFINN